MDWELMVAGVARPRALLRERLARCGLALTESDLARVDDARAEALARLERIELGEPPVALLAEELASSPCLDGTRAADVLVCLQERFYELRDEAPENLPDAALAEGLATAFAQLGGDVALVCSLDLQEVAGEELAGLAYCVSDDAGRVYAGVAPAEDAAPALLDPSDFADGWDGEKWGEELD